MAGHGSTIVTWDDDNTTLVLNRPNKSNALDADASLSVVPALVQGLEVPYSDVDG